MASECNVEEGDLQAAVARRGAGLGSFSHLEAARSSVSIIYPFIHVKKRQASTSMMPRFTKSQTLRGVPVTISTSPCRRACSASFVFIPPISNAHLMCGSCKYRA